MVSNPIDYWYQKYLKEKLTWEDIRKIVVISEDVFEEGNNLMEKQYYEEVLKRFQNTK